MPGISIQFDSSTRQTDIVTETIDELRYSDSYTTDILWKNQSYTVGCSSYPSYPIVEFETADYWIAFEGKIYDETATTSPSEERLTTIAADLFSNDKARLRDWLWETDGEFVIYAIDKTMNEFAIVNDVFGRLPVYYTDTDSRAVFTREVGTFFESSDIDLTFDQYGISQYLLFGYILHDRTLWEDVRTLPSGTQATIDSDGSVSFTSITEFDFDQKKHADKSVEENAKNLADLFVESCRNRVDPDRENVLSLSGGHDSRSIAAAFHAGGLPCSAATFIKTTNDSSSDASIARKIAQEMNLDWQLYNIEPVNTTNVNRLFQLKRGLNHFGLASLIDFFEQIDETYDDDVIYYTGDGGDKALPDLSPSKSLSTREELISYTIEKNSVFSLSEVAAITGLRQNQIVDSVIEVFDDYPETDPSNKYVHFITHERGFSWLFEGEDRNRYYFWSTSPFYSTPFFRYAMNVPDGQKKHNRLYREFLRALWPKAITFDDADFSTPMSSPRYKLVQHGLSFLGRHPSLEEIARVIYRGEITSEYHPNISRLIMRYINTSDSIDQHFDIETMRELANDTSSCGHHQIYNLLTISAAIMMAEQGEAFAEQELQLE